MSTAAGRPPHDHAPAALGSGTARTAARPTRSTRWATSTSFYNNGAVDKRTHNLVNQITGRFGATPVYDANGNLTDNGLTFKAVYDFRNRLIEVQASGQHLAGGVQLRRAEPPHPQDHLRHRRHDGALATCVTSTTARGG